MKFDLEKRKIENFTPINFDNSQVKMTKGQKNLLKMLSNALETNTPISREDIFNCWAKQYPNKQSIREVSKFDWENNKWVYNHVKYKIEWENGYDKTTSMAWFKNNLGSCILKGKLLAIPVINIEK